jgi:ATP-binding cassette, subfamily B, bacterial
MATDDTTIYYRTFSPGPVPKAPWAFMALFVRHRLLWPAVAVIFCAAMSMLTMGFEPPALRGLVNELQRTAGSGEWSPALIGWFALLGGMWVASSVFNRLHQGADIKFSPPMRYMVQAYLFSYLLEHSPRYFQENFAGKLAQKIKQAGQGSIQILGILFHDAVRIVTILVIGVVLLASANILYALLLVAWTAAFLGVAAKVARRNLVLSKALSNEISTSTGRLVDAISNVELIRAFARAAFERDLFSVFIQRERNASRRIRTYVALSHMVLHVAVLAFQVLLIGIAVAQAVYGRMSAGDCIMVVSLSTLIANQVWSLSNRMLEFFEQYGVLADSIDLVTRPHEIVDRPSVGALKVASGEIEFRQVYFAHADGTPVFEGLNLRIAGGEKVGLVGPTGAGKSTLVRLLRRQFVADAGQITVDGQEVGGVTLDSLNLAIGEVPQSPNLFHRTLRENIRYARPEASDAEVEDAARKAHCHEFIVKRAEGYETIVGEQGVRLSGGERQRVAIARAFLKDAPVLVLDEATSSLDSETEHLIQEALFRLIDGRTVIAIAHRLSTITGMDRILYLEHGQILEQGSHAELLRRGGKYAALWHRQVGGFLPEESPDAATAE